MCPQVNTGDKVLQRPPWRPRPEGGSIGANDSNCGHTNTIPLTTRQVAQDAALGAASILQTRRLTQAIITLTAGGVVGVPHSVTFRFLMFVCGCCSLREGNVLPEWHRGWNFTVALNTLYWKAFVVFFSPDPSVLYLKLLVQWFSFTSFHVNAFLSVTI